MIAAKEAVESAGISDINEYKTGLISSTSVGGMDITEKYFYLRRLS
jgi:3-oxoacyl-[acyl-carrier-protein] synthase-1